MELRLHAGRILSAKGCRCFGFRICSFFCSILFASFASFSLFGGTFLFGKSPPVAVFFSISDAEAKNGCILESAALGFENFPFFVGLVLQCHSRQKIVDTFAIVLVFLWKLFSLPSLSQLRLRSQGAPPVP